MCEETLKFQLLIFDILSNNYFETLKSLPSLFVSFHEEDLRKERREIFDISIFRLTPFFALRYLL